METYSEWHVSDQVRRLEVYYQAVELLIWEKKLEKDIIYAVFDTFDCSGKWFELDRYYKMKDGFLAGYKKVSSDTEWPNKKIQSFADYFDANKKIYKTVKRPHVNNTMSDLIIETAIRLDEFYGIAHNAKEIIQHYDIVPTRFGPTILTTLNHEEIKYVTKALYYFINEKESSISNMYVKSKCLESFKDIDEQSIYDEKVSYLDQ